MRYCNCWDGMSGLLLSLVPWFLVELGFVGSDMKYGMLRLFAMVCVMEC